MNTNLWTGGYCPRHGAYPIGGCATCPPPDHPIQQAEAERAARHRASLPVFLASCVAGSVVFLAVLAVGQDVMCAAHDDTLRYCEVQS